MNKNFTERALKAAETPAQQRARILRAHPETSPNQYDLALLFGYRPESFDGMWKLPEGHPVLPVSRNWAVVTEVVTKRGSNVARRWPWGRRVFRFRLKRALDVG